MTEPSPAPTRLAWAFVAAIAVVLVPTVVLFVLAFDTPMPEALFGFRGWGLILAIAFGAAGVLVATRVPSNPIGWILLVAGLGTAIQELALQYLLYGMYDTPGALPRADVAAWIVEWIWIPYMATVALVIPLIYPTGRLPSPRWRPVLVVGVAAAVVGTLFFALVPGPMESTPSARNPFGIEGASWIRTAGDVVLLVFLVGLFAALASIGFRYHRSEGDERQQIKWLLLSLSILFCAFLIGVPYWTLSGPGLSLNLLENVVVIALILIPVSIGIAILKYRLYDIDVVIKKTLVYAVLAVLVFVVGGAVAWAASGLVFTASGEGAYSWLFAGVVIGAAIWPLRRVATRIADRLVYGGRATPYQVLSEFSDRVAGTYASDDVLQRMAQVLATAIGAETATVWLHDPRGFRPGATWPPDATPDDAMPPDAIDVRHQEQVLGALSVRMPANDPMDPAKERLIRDLAAQAGLVLRNAALIDDLKASRVRLVAAQSEERRRIERNIHDGAQQQLVALAVKLKLTDTLIGKDEAKAHALLAELQSDTTQALEDLRDLARGIYPPLLADKGLGAALESQARKSAVPVTIETDGIGRYPQEAEAAVYFACLEALQNIAKYAEASSATVRLAQTNGSLVFEVVDDGRGFDPAAAERGSGLQGIADRLAALGGTLDVRSAPGRGATLVGTIPVDAR